MDASAAENDLVANQADRSAEENAEPDETTTRLPGESPERLNVESLEDRVLLSASPAAPTAAAAGAHPPEEPPALIGSPVAGASAADAGEVVADLAKTAATATGDRASEHKTSHSTESGEIGEVKIETSTEHAAEINESERLERGAQPENNAEDRADSNVKINLPRRVVGELHDEVASDALLPATAANANASTAASEAQAILPSQRGTNGAASEANRLQNDVELSTVIDHLGTERAGLVSSIESHNTAATRDGELASPGLNSEQAANSPAALAQSHAQQAMADLQAAERADAAAKLTSAPQQRSQSVDTPQAHDAYFAATPDLSAYRGVESAVAAPVLSEPSPDNARAS